MGERDGKAGREPGGRERTQSAELRHRKTDAMGEGCGHGERWERPLGTGGTEEEPIEKLLGKPQCPGPAARGNSGTVGGGAGSPRRQAGSVSEWVSACVCLRQTPARTPQHQRSPAARVLAAGGEGRARGGRGGVEPAVSPSGPRRDGGEQRGREGAARGTAPVAAGAAWRGPRCPPRCSSRTPSDRFPRCRLDHLRLRFIPLPAAGAEPPRRRQRHVSGTRAVTSAGTSSM